MNQFSVFRPQKNLWLPRLRANQNLIRTNTRRHTANQRTAIYDGLVTRRDDTVRWTAAVPGIATLGETGRSRSDKALMRTEIASPLHVNKTAEQRHGGLVNVGSLHET